MAATSALARASPFRESEWDRRLDSMLEDLEGAGGGGGGSSKLQSYYSGGQHLGQSSMSSSSYRAQQRHQSSFSSTSLASQQRQQQQQQQSSSFTSKSQFPPTSSTTNGYSVAKSQSNASLHEKADDMLKDLEGSLKASSNYLESRRTVTGPGSREEYHEVRSYSSGGGRGDNTDFNLERQVQHMMPHGETSMMSSSMKQSYSSYKTSSSQSGGIEHQDRPGSRLKQNIDDLDTLLYDLNNVRKVSDGGGDYTASSCVTPGNVSDDYSYHEGTQGHVKRTAQTYDDQSYQVTAASSPPSVRRTFQPQQKQVIDQSSSYKYSSSSAYASSSGQQQKQEQQTRSYAVSSAYPPPRSPPAEPDRRPNLAPSQPLPSPDGTPAGVTYYSKYHSAQSHTSQGKGPSSFPASSPTSTAPRQAPPKRVDHLLSELSEFDSSIKDTRFDEPNLRKAPSPERAPYRSESPVRQVKTDSGPQQSTPGPAVYYPPGDMFASNKKPDASSKPKDKGKNKGKISDPGEGKQGAAVVPICLPLCCAAPCVIM